MLLSSCCFALHKVYTSIASTRVLACQSGARVLREGTVTDSHTWERSKHDQYNNKPKGGCRHRDRHKAKMMPNNFFSFCLAASPLALKSTTYVNSRQILRRVASRTVGQRRWQQGAVVRTGRRGMISDFDYVRGFWQASFAWRLRLFFQLFWNNIGRFFKIIKYNNKYPAGPY